MKNYITKFKNALIFSALILLATSCFKFKCVEQPKAAAINSEFNVRLSVIGDDGGNWVFNKFGLVGIRVPNGWTVSTKENAMTQYAEEGLEFVDGAGNGPGNTTRNLVPNEAYAAFLNERYPLEGYTWIGLSTDSKFVSRLNPDNNKPGGNVADSIDVKFTIHTDAKTGNFKLDYIIGDSDDATNFASDWVLAQDQDANYLECGTFEGEAIKNATLDFNTNIAISLTGIKNINNENYSIFATETGEICINLNDTNLVGAVATIYDFTGKKVLSEAIESTYNTINMNGYPAGIYMVTIAKEGKISFQKVFIK